MLMSPLDQSISADSIANSSTDFSANPAKSAYMRMRPGHCIW